MIENAYKNGSLLKTLSSEDSLICQNYMQIIEQTSNSHVPYMELDVYSKILQILHIVENSIRIDARKPLPTNSDRLMQEILHYINEHYTENITISSLGQIFHVSDSSLSHKFKDYTNKGIYEYILYKRILKTRELMCQDFSLTEIAFQCGFSDYSNFLRAFKKVTGTSPKEYRKKML